MKRVSRLSFVPNIFVALLAFMCVGSIDRVEAQVANINLDKLQKETWVVRSTYHLRKSRDYQTYIALNYYSKNYRDPHAQELVRLFLDQKGSFQNADDAMKSAMSLVGAGLTLIPHPGAVAAGTLLGPASEFLFELTKLYMPERSDVPHPPMDFINFEVEAIYDRLADAPFARRFVDQIMQEKHGIRFGDLNFDPETEGFVRGINIEKALGHPSVTLKHMKEEIDTGLQRLSKQFKAMGANINKELAIQREAAQAMKEEMKTERVRQLETAKWRAELGEMHAGVDILSFLGSRVDPQFGRSIKIVGTASLGILNSAKMFSLGQIGKIALSANILQAGISIASLVGGGVDPQAEQMNAIIGFLQEMGKQLNRMEEKIDRIYETMLVHFEKIEQDLNYLKRVSDKTQQEIRATYTRVALLDRSVRTYIQELSDEQKQRALSRCLDHDAILVRDGFMNVREFWYCLVEFKTAAAHDAYSALWSNRNWDFREGEIIRYLGLPAFTFEQKERSVRYNLNFLSGLAMARYGVHKLPKSLPDPVLWRNFALAYTEMGLKHFSRFPTYSAYTREIKSGAYDLTAFFHETLGNPKFHFALQEDYAAKAEDVLNKKKNVWNMFVNKAVERVPAAAQSEIGPCTGQKDYGILSQPDGTRSFRTYIPVEALQLEHLKAATSQICYRVTLHEPQTLKDFSGTTEVSFDVAKIGIEIDVSTKLTANNAVIPAGRYQLITTSKALVSNDQYIRTNVQGFWNSGAGGGVYPKIKYREVTGYTRDRYETSLKSRFVEQARPTSADSNKSELVRLVDERFDYELDLAAPVWDPYRAIFIPGRQNVFMDELPIDEYESAIELLYESHEIMKAYSEVAQQFGAPQRECDDRLNEVRPKRLLEHLRRSGRKGMTANRILREKLAKKESTGRLMPDQMNPICTVANEGLPNFKAVLSVLETLESLQNACEYDSKGLCLVNRP